LILWL